jgi:hypothetical protein
MMMTITPPQLGTPRTPVKTLVNFTTISVDTTWTVPKYVKTVFAEAIGGGGWGRRLSANTKYPGGGGAAYASKTISTTPGDALKVFVGRGGEHVGLGAVDAEPSYVYNFDKSITHVMAAPGGNDQLNGYGGIGTVTFAGGYGGVPAAGLSGAGGGAAGYLGAGGNATGGTPGTGGGGLVDGGANSGTGGVGVSGVSAGAAGANYGGGGGGGSSTGTTVSGGTGGQGIVRLTYFF